jgi:hypothetical protein
MNLKIILPRHQTGRVAQREDCGGDFQEFQPRHRSRHSHGRRTDDCALGSAKNPLTPADSRATDIDAQAIAADGSTTATDGQTTGISLARRVPKYDTMTLNPNGK